MRAVAMGLMLGMVSLSFAGCAIPAPAPSTSPSITPTPASPAKASPSPTPTPQAETWTTYTTPDGISTFELPVDWTTQSQPSTFEDPAGRPDILIFDETGEQKLQYYPFIEGLGGACDVTFPVHVFDAVEVPIATYDGAVARILYRVAETPEGVVGTLGLTQDEPADFEGCIFYNALNSAALGGISFGTALQGATDQNLAFSSVDQAKAFMTTPEYATLKRIITSLVITG